MLQGCIQEAIALCGAFLSFEFGSFAFKQLEARLLFTVLHHATIANLPYVLFVVANEMKIHYCTLIWFPETKLTATRSILVSVYNRSLKLVYCKYPTNLEHPNGVIPDFRE